MSSDHICDDMSSSDNKQYIQKVVVMMDISVTRQLRREQTANISPHICLTLHKCVENCFGQYIVTLFHIYTESFFSALKTIHPAHTQMTLQTKWARWCYNSQPRQNGWQAEQSAL